MSEWRLCFMLHEFCQCQQMNMHEVREMDSKQLANNGLWDRHSCCFLAGTSDEVSWGLYFCLCHQICSSQIYFPALVIGLHHNSTWFRRCGIMAFLFRMMMFIWTCVCKLFLFGTLQTFLIEFGLNIKLWCNCHIFLIFCMIYFWNDVCKRWFM